MALINNSSLKKFGRLSQKQLTTQLVNEIISGLQCSPFEANAIVDTVHKIYAPYFQTNGSLKPGQILFHVVGIENSPSVPLAKCKQLTVTLTLDDPNEDLLIREQSGVIALRRHRIQRVCIEAFQQGGILTVEDLANRLFKLIHAAVFIVGTCGASTALSNTESSSLPSPSKKK